MWFLGIYFIVFGICDKNVFMELGYLEVLLRVLYLRIIDVGLFFWLGKL